MTSMTPQARSWLAIAAVVGAVGVALGAFGAHGLADRLADLGYKADEIARRIDVFETATRYQLVHALALGLVSAVLDRMPSRAVRLSAWAFLAGVVVFSGLLYVLTFAGPDWRWLGMVVPLGGMAMIAGWVSLAVAAWRDS